MEYTDQSPRADMYAPKSSSRVLRTLMWMLLIVIGLMITAVLLSQPRAAPYVHSGLAKIESIMASFGSDNDQLQLTSDLTTPVEIKDVSALEPTAEPEETSRQKPAVTSMPTSRIPVNRLKLFRKE
jgi:hypothetical protein